MHPTRGFARAGALLAAALLAGSAIPAAGQTNGFMLHCLSARVSGQGCVSRALEGAPTTLFQDPAGIIAFERPALEVDAAAFMPALTFHNTANPTTADGALHAYPLVAAAYIGPRIKPWLSWGFGVAPIGGFGSDFRLDHAVLGTALNYESFFAGLKAGPVLAAEIAPGLSVGASGSVVYAQIRDFRMPFTMPPSAAAGIGALAGLDPHYAALFSGITELSAYGDSKGYAGHALSADLGVSYRPLPGVRVSASWTPRTRITLDGGTATIDMTAQFNQLFGALVQERMTNHGETQPQAQASVMQLLGQAGLDPTRPPVGHYDAATDVTLPQTAGLGASVRAARAWRVSAEAVWMQWSKAENIMPFRLTAGDNPNLNILIAADPANGSFTYPFPLHWKDTWTGRIGLERSLGAAAALRTGFIYGQNAVPDNTVFITFPAIATRAITGGVTWKIGSVPLDISVAHALRETIVGTTGTHLLGSEYRGSVTTLSETVVTFGAVLPLGR